jgi:hypothetical protein
MSETLDKKKLLAHLEPMIIFCTPETPAYDAFRSCAMAQLAIHIERGEFDAEPAP